MNTDLKKSGIPHISGLKGRLRRAERAQRIHPKEDPEAAQEEALQEAPKAQEREDPKEAERADPEADQGAVLKASEALWANPGKADRAAAAQGAENEEFTDKRYNKRRT